MGERTHLIKKPNWASIQATLAGGVVGGVVGEYDGSAGEYEVSDSSSCVAACCAPLVFSPAAAVVGGNLYDGGESGSNTGDAYGGGDVGCVGLSCCGACDSSVSAEGSYDAPGDMGSR